MPVRLWPLCFSGPSAKLESCPLFPLCPHPKGPSPRLAVQALPLALNAPAGGHSVSLTTTFEIYRNWSNFGSATAPFQPTSSGLESRSMKYLNVA